jgi:exonuclease SbcD
MKIAHFSDLHYSVPNLDESDKTFGFAVKEAIRTNVQCAIISGDSTDHRLDAHSPALLALAKRIKQLADHCPVLMLQGTFSHEPVGILNILGMIGAKHPIFIADKIGMVGLYEGQWEEYDPTYQNNPKYDVVISTLPTVNKADLLILVDPTKVNEEMGNYVADILTSFSSINAKLRSESIPTVLVSHGTVSGSMNESGVPMAGLDHEFTIGALFAANTDAVMLGHIHLHQSWERDFQNAHQVIAYPGSIGRFHYGEIGEKYFISWSVQPGNASFDAIITPSRKMIDIEFTGVPDLEELARVAKDCEGAFVRVRYEVDEEFMKQVDRNAIKQILALSSEVKVEGSVLTIQRQRCAGISKVASLEDQFIQWCKLTNTPIDGLIERLSKLQTMDSKELAHEIVRNKMDPPEYLAAA